MRILVTGKNGQLGKSINKIVDTSNSKHGYQQNNEFIFTGIKTHYKPEYLKGKLAL
jgi:dTDP-4-dehydrorhamnose reductase